MDLLVKLEKEHLFFLLVSLFVFAGIAVGQSTVSHNYDEVVLPSGTWSGLDADTVDGWQAEELGDPSGCATTTNTDASGAHEFGIVCWNRNLKKIWACAYQLTHDGDFWTPNPPSGNCQIPGIPSEFWAGEGTVHFCSATSTDAAGAHEFGYACSGTNGILVCAAQLTHQGEWHSGIGNCQYRPWA